MKSCKNYKNVTQRYEVNKCCWKNDAHRLAWCRAVTNLQFVKNAISVKHSKAKHIKVGYACIYFILYFLSLSISFCCGEFSDTPSLMSLWLCLFCYLTCLFTSHYSHIQLSLLLLREGWRTSLLLVSTACIENYVIHDLVYLL